jgi:molybdopterin synthase catalytic subunit
MAEAEIARVVAEAEARWPGIRATAIHRYGSFAPGEPIVLVITAAAHRGEAFAAAEMLMDYLKTRAPFWKRMRYADGSQGEWVGAKADDDDAVARWDAG